MPIRPPNIDNARSVKLPAAHENHTHAHSDITDQTANDHHNEDHAARHADGGADEITVVEAQISDLDHYDDTDANAAIDARVTKAFVEALSIVITEAQISDLDHYNDTDANAAIDARVTKAFIEALTITITESQITDLDHYTDSDVTALVNKAFVDALNVDADTLDGSDSTAFAGASHTHTESEVTDLDHYDDTDANAAIDARVTKAFVEALSIAITESQITDLDHYTDSDVVALVTKAFVEALTIDVTEAQITDLDHYDSSDFATDVASTDAADHGSGASSDGQVLTSDGAGGAAWEDATGGGAAAAFSEFLLIGA